MRKITRKFILYFENFLIEGEKSENTIEKYIRDVKFFAKWLCEGEVTKVAVLEYKKEMCVKYAISSVNSMISSLNAFFKFMNWQDVQLKTMKMQRRIFTSKDKELSKNEYERLLITAKNKKNNKIYYLMQTVCSTGIRISELKFITVSSVKSGQAIINCKGKMRVVILPRELCKMLKNYIKENNIKSGSVFVTKTRKPLDRSYIWKSLKALCKEAGVNKEKVFPHNLRHLFARTYYTMQKDIVRLADILGHSSINTTRIYTMENGEIHRKQIEKLGLLRL